MSTKAHIMSALHNRQQKRTMNHHRWASSSSIHKTQPITGDAGSSTTIEASGDRFPDLSSLPFPSRPRREIVSISSRICAFQIAIVKVPAKDSPPVRSFVRSCPTTETFDVPPTPATNTGDRAIGIDCGEFSQALSMRLFVNY